MEFLFQKMQSGNSVINLLSIHEGVSEVQSLSACLKRSGEIFWREGVIIEIKFSHEVCTLIYICLRVSREEVLITNLLFVDPTEIYLLPFHQMAFFELKQVQRRMTNLPAHYHLPMPLQKMQLHTAATVNTLSTRVPGSQQDKERKKPPEPILKDFT